MALRNPFDLYHLQNALNSIDAGVRIFQQLMDAVPQVVADTGDAGAIAVTEMDGYCYLTIGAGAETRTMGNPTLDGQRMTISVQSHGGGSCVVTVANTFNTANDTQATWSAAADNGAIAFVARRDAGNLRWFNVAADVVTLGSP